MDKKEIPPGQSPVRFIMQDKHPFHPLAGFEAAKADPDGVVVFEGDYGGQIMMTVRMSHVGCSERALDLLLHDLNEIAWDGYEGSGLYYERIPVGGGVVGGMGGGVVTNGVWIHARFIKDVGDIDELYAAVDEVIAGRAQRIPKYLGRKDAPTSDGAGGEAGLGAPETGP